MHNAREILFNRLRWRSRRGMLELDLILQVFLEQQLPLLTEQEIAAYQRLLDCTDPVLLDYASGRANPEDAVEMNLVARWRSALPAQQ